MSSKVEIEGIYYDFKFDKLSGMVARNSNSSGDIIIPESVTYDGMNYNVTSIEEKALGYFRVQVWVS